MKRGWLIIACVSIVVVVGVILTTMRTKVATAPEAQSSSLPYSDYSAEIRTDSITELLVEFGDVPYSATAVKSIRLKNTTDKPLVFVDYQATCRCTTIDLPQKAIEPNEWAEAELMFDSRGEYGSVGNHIVVNTSDELCVISIWTSAEVKN